MSAVSHSLVIHSLNCQAQGPTLGPTQGRVKVKVRTWSGHGQVMVRSWSGHGQVMVRSGLTLTPTPTQKWDLSYTLKLVSTHSLTHHSPPPPHHL